MECSVVPQLEDSASFVRLHVQKVGVMECGKKQSPSHELFVGHGQILWFCRGRSMIRLED